MKKSIYTVLMTFILAVVIIVGAVNIYAAADPYTEVAFVDHDDLDDPEEQPNEFSADRLKVEASTDYGNIGGTYKGAWLVFEAYDFGTAGATSVEVFYANNSTRCAADAVAEIWIDGMDAASNGIKAGTVELTATADNWDTYAAKTANLTKITGVHDIYIVLDGTTASNTPFISNLSYFKFIKDPNATEAPVTATAAAETQTPTEAPETAKPTQSATATKTATVKPATSTPTSSDDTERGLETWVVIVIIVAVLAIGGGAACFTLIKKKKK